MRFVFCGILLLVFSLAAGAEELLPKVQRELRARKFYFGEINGRATDETVGAIVKFQEAHGLDKTGNLNDETLRTLGLPGDGLANPEEVHRLDDWRHLRAAVFASVAERRLGA
ncbi:MAG: peptidoglycan-binding domain-containing protein [Chthoniobacter sp.]